MRATLATLVVAVACSSATAQVTFTNNTPFIIPTVGTAAVYPSTITVSGYTGSITDVQVTLTGFNHTFVDDLGVIFAGPGAGAQGTWLFDGGPDGGTGPLGDGSPINLVFSAAGTTMISPTDTFLLGGTYLPGLNEYGDLLNSPAPASPGIDFSSLIGQQPDGDYNLFIQDFVTGDGGGVGSWSITLSGISPVPEPTSIVLLGIPAIGSVVWRRRRAGV